MFSFYLYLPGGSDGKASARNAGDLGSIPGLGRSPGEGNGNPLQHSCLENSMDGEAWWATVHGILQARRLEWVAFPFPGYLLNPGIEPRSPALRADSLLSEQPRKPMSNRQPMGICCMTQQTQTRALTT